MAYLNSLKEVFWIKELGKLCSNVNVDLTFSNFKKPIAMLLTKNCNIKNILIQKKIVLTLVSFPISKLIQYPKEFYKFSIS